MKIGILREGKIPPDARAPLTPLQCAEIKGARHMEVVVQSSRVRAFSDAEYVQEDIAVVDDVRDCDILLGVKEVPVSELMPDKTYFMFSHTIKKQPHNRDLLRAVLRKRITLIDYETLTDERGIRLIAFGKFAGMVGAHNALWVYGKRKGTLELPRMHECREYAEMQRFYRHSSFPRCKIVLTGTGRVANGAAKVLHDMGIKRLSPEDFAENYYTGAAYTQLGVTDYATKKGGGSFSESEYFAHPEDFHIDFSPFYSVADIMINGIYWDPRSPAFFNREEMRRENFRIEVIADVTCDIAPKSSIPSTLRPASISAPVFGFDPATGAETAPFLPGMVDMMTIDNLPSELPRDASEAFGEQFIEHVLPELVRADSPVLNRATIAADGRLGEHFTFLADYVA